MIKAVFALLILGIVVVAVSTGILILSEARLDDLPQKPVNQLVIAEKKNLEETKDLSQIGILAGAGAIGVTLITSGFLYWRNR